MPDTLFTGARLIDPASGLDTQGDLLVRDGRILDHGAGLGRPEGALVIAAEGHVLAPGLIDLRAAIGEPGAEHRETIASAAEAAAAGGITTLCVLPDTDPALDDPALVQFARSRGEATGSLTLLPTLRHLCYQASGHATRQPPPELLQLRTLTSLHIQVS